GIRFLKHIERCRVFLHVLDLTREDPYADYIKINHELEMYNEALLDRPQIIVANKIDMPGTDLVLKKLEKQINKPIMAISAMQQKDVDKLLFKVLETLRVAPKIIEEESTELTRDYIFKDDEPAFIITKVDDAFELTGEKLRVIFERTDFTKDEAVKRFARQLRSMGVDDALRQEGAKNKDTIRIFDFEFEFIE
ncbi:MAG: GTPase ObgE, partial [Tenericutes bacterium HGW-Tenericutes-3]